MLQFEAQNNTTPLDKLARTLSHRVPVLSSADSESFCIVLPFNNTTYLVQVSQFHDLVICFSVHPQELNDMSVLSVLQKVNEANCCTPLKFTVTYGRLTVSAVTSFHPEKVHSAAVACAVGLDRLLRSISEDVSFKELLEEDAARLQSEEEEDGS